jgi:hypothetical protein
MGLTRRGIFGAWPLLSMAALNRLGGRLNKGSIRGAFPIIGFAGGWSKVSDPRVVKPVKTPAGGLREPWNQPFAANSVWNTPIGSGAKWSDLGDPGTAQLVTVGAAVNCAKWSQPHYIGTASDPLVTVICTDPLYPVSPQKIHIPIGATPDPSDDAHMNFFDKTTKLMWSYWGCSLNNGRDVTGGITAGLGGVYSVCGDGVNSLGKGYGDYNFGIGTIRDYDLAAGAIQHALRYSASDDLIKSPQNTGKPAVDWIAKVPWPEHHTDYNGDKEYKGNLLYASTIGIPSTVKLESLGLSQGGMMLAKALQDYGAIMRDAGGANSVNFYVEPLADVHHASLVGQMASDAPKLVKYLRVLQNQGPDKINGGGTPLVAGPPPLDPAICR